MGVAGKKKLVHCHNSRTKPGRSSGVLAEEQVVARVVAHVIATYTQSFAWAQHAPRTVATVHFFAWMAAGQNFRY